MKTVTIYLWNFIGVGKDPRLYMPDMSKWQATELHVESGIEYILPEGYELKTTVYGEPFITDNKGYKCDLVLLNNVPAIVSSKGLLLLRRV